MILIDKMAGGADSDRLNTGACNDIAQVLGDTGVTQNLTQAEIEIAVGGRGDGVLIGGDDIVVGGAVNDALAGEEGDDILEGGLDDARLTGGDGNDVIKGSHGDDVTDGGAGIDIADFSGSFADYRLTQPVAASGGQGGNDGSNTLINIEKLTFGGVSAVDIKRDNPLPVKDVITIADGAGTKRISVASLLAYDQDWRSDALHNTTLSDVKRDKIVGSANNGEIPPTQSNGGLQFNPDSTFTGVMSFKYIWQKRHDRSEGFISDESGEPTKRCSIISTYFSRLQFCFALLLCLTAIPSVSIAEEILLKDSGTAGVAFEIQNESDLETGFTRIGPLPRGWKGSMYSTMALGPGDQAVALCGDTGQVAYFRSLDGDSLTMEIVNLRTGRRQGYQLKVADLTRSPRWYSPADITLTCSVDAKKLLISKGVPLLTTKINTNQNALSFTDEHILVDLAENKFSSFATSEVPRGLAGSRLVNPNLSILVGLKAKNPEENPVGVSYVESEALRNIWLKFTNSREVSLGELLFDGDTVLLLVTEKPTTSARTSILLVELAPNGLSTMRSCQFRFDGDIIQKSVFREGLVFVESRASRKRQVRPYILRFRNETCRPASLENWRDISARANPPAYAFVQKLLFKIASAPPSAMNSEMTSYITIGGDASQYRKIALPHQFKGVESDTQSMWRVLSDGSNQSVTFGYGPHGDGTVFVHIWQ